MTLSRNELRETDPRAVENRRARAESRRSRLLFDVFLFIGIVGLLPAGAYALAAGAWHLTGIAGADELATAGSEEDDAVAGAVPTP